ncbi:MAG TPA: hypothetical protein VGC89_10370 [Pyrinomonadaceae bacterium]
MLDTPAQTGRRSPNDESIACDRLNRLLIANREEAARRRLFRDAEDEEQRQLMRRPVSTERAYALFGLLLGALPPAIFFRFLHVLLPRNQRDYNDLFFFCLVMNVVCMLVGGIAGAKLGRRIDEIERQSWSRMLLLAGLNGLLWAIATGAAGGAIVFIAGALFGATLMLPIGALAFVIFTALHRQVAHGGMIDARHLWPLACGVAAFIAALILQQ